MRPQAAPNRWSSWGLLGFLNVRSSGANRIDHTPDRLVLQGLLGVSPYGLPYDVFKRDPKYRTDRKKDIGVVPSYQDAGTNAAILLDAEKLLGGDAEGIRQLHHGCGPRAADSSIHEVLQVTFGHSGRLAELIGRRATLGKQRLEP
ncbi:MAG: hypothetical protein M3O70_23120 [Actinomycetota bacterium]|nr:hypothetical protein [Actinomycetota bacterium]